MRNLWFVLAHGIILCFIAGLALDFTGPSSFGTHLAVQIPAGFIGLFIGAWRLDRRAARSQAGRGGADG